MVWSRNDSWMVTADQTGYVKYWQSNMNNVKMFQAHKEPVRAIRFDILLAIVGILLATCVLFHLGLYPRILVINCCEAHDDCHNLRLDIRQQFVSFQIELSNKIVCCFTMFG